MLGDSSSTTPLVSTLAAPATTLATTLVRRVREWPVAAQQQARRNAMIAATACAQRRAEREEAADYVRHRAEERARSSVERPVVAKRAGRA